MAPQKVSPGGPEDLPELNAGSSESEDLPDPTRASYPPLAGPVNGRADGKMRNERHFTSAPDYWPAGWGNIRSLA